MQRQLLRLGHKGSLARTSPLIEGRATSPKLRPALHHQEKAHQFQMLALRRSIP
jgi:hypothetical protein